MNKKVVLSVLSATFVASMAASAFAAPNNGLYIGGNVKSHYSFDTLMALDAAGLAKFKSDMASIGTDFNNLVYVSLNGKGASITEIMAASSLEEANKDPLKKEDFADQYNEISKSGAVTGTYDARKDVEGTTPGELKVDSVSAINASGVEFKFAALTADIKGATVEVKDNNNNVVPVVAQDLVKGETSAAFDFVTALTTAPTGVWKVNGVSFNLDDVKKFDDIVAAAFSGNEVTTLSLLKAAGLTDIKDEQISNYVAAINTSTTKQTLADIQAIIKTVNDTALTGAEEKAITDAVNNATNQVQLLAALQNKAFKHVNADWIQQYKADIDAVKAPPAFGTTDTVIEIQAIVDAANIAKIGAANTAATTAAAQNAVTALIQAYMVDDATTSGALTPKADAIKLSQTKAAVFKVKEATTQGTLFSALTALSALDSTGLPAASLNGNLKAEYLAAHATATFTNAASIKTTVVDAGATAALTAALGATGIDGLTATSTDAQIKAALQKLANVTAHETVVANKFDISTVKDAKLNAYVNDTTNGFLTNAPGNTLADVKASIAAINGAADQQTYLDTIANSSSTAAQVKTALTELASKAPSNSTTTAYLNASSQVKLEVAQFIVDNRANLATTLTVANVTDNTGTTYATAPLKTAIQEHNNKVADFNDLGDIGVARISDIKAVLDTYAYAPYAALSTSDKLAVSEHIRGLTKKDSTGADVSLDFGGADAVTTLKAANAIIDAAIKKVENGEPAPTPPTP